MEILASDKTGTLTLNRLQLDKQEIVAAKGHAAEDVLLMASLSAKWSNNDAIDKAVTGAMGGDQKVWLEQRENQISSMLCLLACKVQFAASDLTGTCLDSARQRMCHLEYACCTYAMVQTVITAGTKHQL